MPQKSKFYYEGVRQSRVASDTPTSYIFLGPLKRQHSRENSIEPIRWTVVQESRAGVLLSGITSAFEAEALAWTSFEIINQFCVQGSGGAEEGRRRRPGPFVSGAEQRGGCGRYRSIGVATPPH